MAKTATAPTAEKLPMIASQATVNQTLNIDPHANTWSDLEKVKVKPLNLDVEYWRPEVEGESKTLVFMELREGDSIPDFNDPENVVEKDCAYLVEKQGDSLQVIRTGSRRLVTASRNFMIGDVYQITFMGKRKNRTNNNLSNFFAIQAVSLG